MMLVLRAIAFFVFLFSIYGAQGQERDSVRYEFVKNNGKPKHLKSFRSIELHLKDSLPPAAYTTRSHLLSGYLMSTTSDSIIIDLQTERWMQRWEGPLVPEGYIPVRQHVYSRFMSDTTELLRAIPLDRIDHVTYDSNIQGAGAFITVVSAIGLLVYAPLKAMKFKDGNFDGDKYIQVATPCLIGVGIGLVVMPFTEGKRRVNVKLGL